MPKLARFRAKHSSATPIAPPGATLEFTSASASALTPILHIDMDAFFVSVELLSRAELRGLPVIVGGRKDQRGVVTSASYEARRFGVHSAMPLRTAGKLCPHGIFLNNSHELYSQWSDRIACILARHAPRVEMASVDEAYLDFSGTERLHGPPLVAADKLLREIRKTTGLPCSAGLASTRLVAKVASEQAKPQGLVWVPAGIEAEFLAPLDVRKIPGIGRVTESALNALGIRTVGQLAAIPLEKLEDGFGRWGTALYRKALGQDSYEFFLDAEPRSISHNETFGVDTNDRAHLESTLSYLAQKAAKRLRDSGLYAAHRERDHSFRGFPHHHAQQNSCGAFRSGWSHHGDREIALRAQLGRPRETAASRRLAGIVERRDHATRPARRRQKGKAGATGARRRQTARPLWLQQNPTGRLAEQPR